MTKMMTDARLIALIEAWGADVHAFPETERDAAAALLSAEPQRFAPHLTAAREMDILLGAMPEAAPSAALTAALIDSAPKPKSLRRSWFAALPRWPAAGALASLAIGLAIGLGTAQPVTGDTSEDAVDTLVYAALGFDTLTYIQEAAQ
tara:strand:+ start:26554 stop:26997 length:444 start_codon:yes stop_codon:yes gene_type:complete